MSEEIETVELQTGDAPSGSVIWLHGLGADGHDFEPIVPELALPADLPLRFVFPHAPVQPVTINGGMQMRAWYDIVSLDSEGRADRDGIQASSRILEQLADRENDRGIADDRIIIAGFSQGGAVALHSVTHGNRRFAGLIALSTYLALQPPESVAFDQSPPVPAFAAHGTFDPMVPFQGGRAAGNALEGLGFDVEWHEYPMAHGVCPQEISEIGAWMRRVYGVS